MKSALLLAWRYLAHHRARTILLIVAVASTALLPIAVNTLVTRYSAALLERARSTSLVLGAPGSRYDLVLNALYFTGRVPTRLSMAEFTTLAAADQARAIPIHVVHHAKGFPVVGTSVDYFEVRGLAFAAGTPFAELGEAVVGARVARELGLAPGGFLLSDQGSLYDLTMRYPLRMRVVGVLAHSGTPDDGAVFVDVKTAWIMDGLGHGHVDAKAATPNEVLGAKNDRIALSAAVVEYQEVTPENVDSFHFHGDPDTFPLTAVLVEPYDARAQTLLKGRYRVEKAAQLLVPTEVIEEILGFVLRLKRFFDANAVLVSVATVMFLALVVLLSLRLRQREAETLFKLGCARATIARILALELAICVGCGLVLAVAGAAILVTWMPRFA